MKKKIKAFFALYLSCVSIFISVFALDEIQNFTTEQAALEYEQVYGTLIYKEGTVSDEKAYEYAVYYTMIPSDIIDLFYDYNVKIYVSDSASLSGSASTYTVGLSVIESLSYYRDTGIIASYTDPYILLSTNTTLEESIVHEAGHIFEYILSVQDGHYDGSFHPISSTQEWQTLYEWYKYNIAALNPTSASNTISSAKECYSEAFMLTYVYPELMYEACPAVYEFILSSVQEYMGVGSLEEFDADDYAMRYPEYAEYFGYDKAAMYDFYVSTGQYGGQIAKFV